MPGGRGRSWLIFRARLGDNCVHSEGLTQQSRLGADRVDLKGKLKG